MNHISGANTQAVVVDEVFPHAAAVVWKALTSSSLMGRWMMPAKGFAPIVGQRFTFETKPAGEWDGTISCQVLQVEDNALLSYSWSGGHDGNQGYGSKLETVVTITLSPVDAGTRMRLVHSGFLLPQNEVAYRNMSDGWTVVVKRLETVVAEETSAPVQH